MPQYSPSMLKQLRADILAQVSFSSLPDEMTWWLLGTKGCHLCEVAEQRLVEFQSVVPVSYINVDIADFDEPLMMQFATQIPVILTQNARLDFPFSVLDLQNLL